MGFVQLGGFKVLIFWPADFSNFKLGDLRIFCANSRRCDGTSRADAPTSTRSLNPKQWQAKEEEEEEAYNVGPL